MTEGQEFKEDTPPTQFHYRTDTIQRYKGTSRSFLQTQAVHGM